MTKLAAHDRDKSISKVGARSAAPEAAQEAATPLVTPDGRYIVVRGRLWRATNPNLSPERRARLVGELMDARRAVGVAKRSKDRIAEAAAHAAVEPVKVALGERGAPWWDDGAPDLNRRLIKNTDYAQWYVALNSRNDISGD